MLRSVTTCLALVVLTAPTHAQNRALKGGEVLPDGTISLGNSLPNLGKRLNGKTVITPDTLQILGAGSTGDVSTMSVRPTGAPAGQSLADTLANIPTLNVARAGLSARTLALSAFTLSGFYAPGDRGNGTVYERVPNASFPGAVADASGVYYAPKRSGTTPLRAGSYGARGDASASDTSALNTMVAAARSVGAAARIEAGMYLVNGAGLTLDYSGQTADATVQPVGVSLNGDGPHNTVLLAAEPSRRTDPNPRYAVNILGAIASQAQGVQSFAYLPFGGFSVGRGAQTQDQSLGMHIKSAQFLHGRDVLFQGLGVGLDIESGLSSTFDNFQFAYNQIGLLLRKGSGFSNANALSFNKPIFRLNTSAGIASDSAVTALSLNEAQIEGNGTMGDLTSGGAYLQFNADQEGGSGLVMNGGYVEGNKGGFDLFLNNTGTSTITHVISGVTFNQYSGTNYAQSRIKVRGPTKLVLIAISFKAYNEYSCSASRPVIDYNPLETEVIIIGSDLGCMAERNGLRNQHELVYRGSVGAAGVAQEIPQGWTVVKNGTGAYTVTAPIGVDVSKWSVNATAVNSSIERVNNVYKQNTASSLSFTVITMGTGTTQSDSGFDFIVRF